MKKKCTILFALSLFVLGTSAQELPFETQQVAGDNPEESYYTGFDSMSGMIKEGWKQFRTGTKEGGGWGVSASLSHDYCPDAGFKNKKADDWFVSPAFSIGENAKIDSVAYKSLGWMSKVLEGDTIAIYLLRGSQDPARAKERIVLFDMRGDDYPYATSDVFVKKDISLGSPSEKRCYIAFRYKSNDVNLSWYTVYFDDLYMSGVSKYSGVQPTRVDDIRVSVYPNPCHSVINLRGVKAHSSIYLYALNGSLVYSATVAVDGDHSISMSDFADGVYLLQVVCGGEMIQEKIIKQ